MILLIDNYDSFTYNLYQYIGELYHDIQVVRNDEITIEQIEEMHPQALILSPGPGYPKDAGITMETIRHFNGKIPMLGVCLGHQSICEAFGGNRPGSASDARQGKPDGTGYHKPHFRRTAENGFLRQVSFADCPGIGFSGVPESNSTG